MKGKFIAAVLLLCLVFAVNAFSQSSNGSLGGIVQDPSGALVPGVTVTLTNAGTGIVNTTISNESGKYTFPSVLELPGTYRLDASLSKTFRISENKAMQVRVDATNVLNHADPGAPTLTLSDAFGNIAAKGAQVRNFQGQLRFSF